MLSILWLYQTQGNLITCDPDTEVTTYSTNGENIKWIINNTETNEKDLNE